MSCLDPAEIARVLTLELDEPHFAECLPCRRRLEADRATRDVLRSLPVPALTQSHRRALAAELIATADHRPRRRGFTRIAIGGGLAVAAALALALWPRSLRPESVTVALDSREPIALASRSAAPEDEPPRADLDLPAAPAIAAASGARFEHRVGADRDAITLIDGVLDLDTRGKRAVDVAVGDTAIAVTDAAVHIEAHRRSVVSVKVVVGAARIDSAEHHLVLQRDSEWLPAPSAKTRSLTAFRDAWIALRGGRNADAMRLFDSVVDPVVLEEASWWAQVAARRANDPSADDRLAKFRQAFPQSDYTRP